MKGIRLTPFLLFLILLLVLVIAMIFGYRSNSIVEGNTNMESNSNGDWLVGNKSAVTNYYNSRKLDVILESDSGSPGYYFDNSNGNIIVATSADASTFSVITRSSTGKPSIVTTSYPEGQDSVDNESEIVSMATPWSYQSDNVSLLYCPYQTSTFIVLFDNTSDNILSVFKIAYK